MIDDTLIENTETAILSIGSHSGIGQIFDNDSLREPTETSAVIALIDANSVTEGDGNKLVYRVELDQEATVETRFNFDFSGDAIGAPENVQNQVDYLNSDRVELSTGSSINDGNHHFAGVQSFTASVPVIDTLSRHRNSHPLDRVTLWHWTDFR